MPVRFLYFLLPLLLATTGLRAQSVPAPGPPTPPAFPSGATPPAVPVPSPTAASRLTRADTARAIRKLFRSRRGGGIAWLLVGTAGILASTLPALQTTSAGVWAPGVVVGSGMLLVGLNKRIQFRPGRERRVLRELAATGHLPASVARRLRGNFTPMRGAASDYDPLTAPGIRPSNAPLNLTPAEAAEAARADTLRAINRLFARRRRGGRTWNYLALAGSLSLVRALISTSANGSSADGGSVALLSGAFVAAPLAIGLVNLTTYSEAHQQEVENTYRAGKPLPPRIRQRIKQKDLQPYD